MFFVGAPVQRPKVVGLAGPGRAISPAVAARTPKRRWERRVSTNSNATATVIVGDVQVTITISKIKDKKAVVVNEEPNSI